jgi:hypothetical protein
MPITERHVFGWNEASVEEKLEGLHDWCNILTAKLKAAGEETRRYSSVSRDWKAKLLCGRGQEPRKTARRAKAGIPVGR